MSNIEYRPFPSCPRYAVGSDGTVIGPSGKTLSPGLDTDGYLQVLVYPGGGARRLSRKVHRLVCETFNGPQPSPMHQVAHWDGDHLNNRASNLRWATSKENIGDKVRHGRVSRTSGEIDGMAKLTDDQVRDIRQRAGGVSQYRLAAEFDVTQPTISNIIARKSWRHI